MLGDHQAIALNTLLVPTHIVAETTLLEESLLPLKVH